MCGIYEIRTAILSANAWCYCYIIFLLFSVHEVDVCYAMMKNEGVVINFVVHVCFFDMKERRHPESRGETKEHIYRCAISHHPIVRKRMNWK